MNDKPERVVLLDELRGFAILCMVFYHLMYNLKFMLGINVPVFFENWFDPIRDAFAGLFICISGIVCNYSRNNLKRGAQCFFIGMAITFITAYAVPESPDMFGILHCLGISMMIYGLAENVLKKISVPIGTAAGIILFIASFNFPYGYAGIKGILSAELPGVLYRTRVMFPLGFPRLGFNSLDYFPLMPWLFLFLAGTFFGRYVKAGGLPDFCRKTHIKFFALCGRHSLLIYVAHQPVILLVIYTVLAFK